MKKITIIGAGITGITAAYYLAKQGHKVSVIEQELYPAMRTSFANGGQVSVSNSEVWTTWHNVFKGLQWMSQKDAPLLIRPQPSWDKISWLSKFLYYTLINDSDRNTAETIRLGMESRSLYHQLVIDESLEFDQSYCGILHFYKDREYYEKAQRIKGLYNANKCEWDILTADETIAVDPALQNVEDVVGGAWTAGDWTGDIHKFCMHLQKVLETKYDVDFTFGLTVDKLALEELLFENDAIVVSAGVGSKQIANFFGDNLPIYPVKGYSITINVQDNDLKYMPKVSLLDDEAKIVTSTLGNRFRVAGTAELAGENYDIRYDRVKPLLEWVRTNFPNINTHDYTSWACLRPMTPNMMPIVKKSKKFPVYYHTGHGHLGWTLSPATSMMLVNLIGND